MDFFADEQRDPHLAPPPGDGQLSNPRVELHLQVGHRLPALPEGVPDDGRRLIRVPLVPEQQKHEGVGDRLGGTDRKLL